MGTTVEKAMIFFAFLGIGCKESAKLASRDSLQMKVKFAIVSGADQTVSPGLPLREPIIVKLLDSKDQPVVNARLSYCLTDVTHDAAAETLLSERVKRCQSAGQPSGASEASDQQPSPPPAGRERTTVENQVGAVLEASPVSDTQGFVTVMAKAPTSFGKKITLVIYMSDSLGENLGTTVNFSTVNFGQSEIFQLESSGQSKEIVGKKFDLTIKVLDAEGYLVTNYDTTRDFTILAETPRSWAGRLPKLPESRFSCQFVAGRCTVPEGPWIIMGAGTTRFRMTDHGNADRIHELSVDVSKGEETDLILGNKAGGIDSDAVPLTELILNPGDLQHIAAYATDIGGNRLRLANDATWMISNPLLQETVPMDPRASFVFTSNTSGTAILSASSDHAKANPINIKVRHGSHATWKITTEHNQIERAGECFKLSVTALDKGGNIVEDFEGQWDLIVAMGGTTESGPAVANTAHFEVLNLPFGTSIPVSAQFVAGTATLDPRACLYDASDVAPKILIQSQTSGPKPQIILGEQSVQVLVGPPVAVGLSTAPFGTPGLNPCKPGVDTSDDPCLVLTTDDQGLRYYAFVTDLGGNPLRASSATWKATGPLAGTLPGTATSEFADISPSIIGNGVLDVVAPEGYRLKRFYTVKHGQPKNYLVSSEHNGSEVATQPFQIKLIALDRFGNRCESFTGAKLFNFQLENAELSPSPVYAQPSPEFIELVTFIDGKAQSTGRLQATRATNVLKPSDPKPNILAVSEGASFRSPILSILPGIPKTLQFRSGARGGGIHITAPIGLQQDRQMVLFIASYDELANFVQDEDARFEASGVLKDTLVANEGTSTVIVPTDTGTGKVTATALAPGIASASLDPINVTASRAERLVIETTHQQNEVAGEPFNITIRALDRDGNTAVQYTGEKTLKFEPISSRSWAGFEARLPFDNIVCPFEAGVCILGGAETPTEFFTTDDEVRYILTVQDVGNEVLGVFAQRISCIKGPPYQLLVTSTLGGPPAGATPLVKPIDITADDTRSFAAAVVDRGGNYLSDAPAGTLWQKANTNVEEPDVFAGNLGSAGGASVNFTPTIVGHGSLSAKSGGLVSGNSPTITITHGRLAQATILPEHGADGEVAGEAFSFGIRLSDAKGNTFRDFNGEKTVKLSLVDSVSGPATVGLGRFYIENNESGFTTLPKVSTVQTLTLSFAYGLVPVVMFNGEPVQIVLFDATDVHPKINLLIANGIDGIDILTDPIKVRKGLPHHISLMLSPDDTGEFFCQAPAELGIGTPYSVLIPPSAGERQHVINGFGNYADPEAFGGEHTSYVLRNICRGMSVADGPTRVYAVVHDAGGNYLGPASGTWSLTPHLPSKMPMRMPLLLQDFEPAQDGRSVLLRNRIATYYQIKSGQPPYAIQTALTHVNLQFTSVEMSGLHAKAPFFVAAGAPESFNLGVSSSFVADMEAHLQVNFLDQHGNILTNNIDTSGTQPGFGGASNEARINRGGLGVWYASSETPTFGLTVRVDNDFLPFESSWVTGKIPSPSPKGSPPELPIRKAGGIHFRAKACNLNNLPCVIQGSFPRAYENAVIAIDIPNMTPATQTISVPVLPGAGVSFQIFSRVGPDPLEFPVNQSFVAGDDIAIYGGLYDSERNFAITWPIDLITATGVMQDRVTGEGTTNIRILPTTAGEGQLLLKAAEIQAEESEVVIDLGHITVSPGPLNHYQVIGGPSGTIAPGSAFDLQLAARDRYENLISSYQGFQRVAIQLEDRGANQEQRIAKAFVGTSPELRFSNSESNFALDFADGMSVTPLRVELFSASPSNRLYISIAGLGASDLAKIKNDGYDSGIIYGISAPFSMPPGPADHYGTTISENFGGPRMSLTSDNYFPRADQTTTMSVNISTRDAYGNLVASGESGVQLKVVNIDGSPATGNLVGPISDLDLTSGVASVSGIAWDAEGTFRIVAEKPNGGLLTTPVVTNPAAASLLVAEATIETVARYYISIDPTIIAGANNDVAVHAVDNSGTPVRGIDFVLNSIPLEFTGANVGPDGTAASFQRESFVNGKMRVKAKFFKAETIPAGMLRVSEQPVSTRNGSVGNTVFVSPGPVQRYEITSSRATATADDQGVFDLTISSFDGWSNPTPGITNTSILPQRIAGSTNVGKFYGPSVTNIDLSGRTTTVIAGLNYRVPHEITFKIAGSTNQVVNSPTMAFTPTIRTVQKYGLVLPTTITTGVNNLPVSVQALDEANNIIQGIDSLLNTQFYTWSGALRAPNGADPVYAPLNFSNGTSSVTHSLFGAQILEIGDLTLNDNHYPWRTGINVAGLTVNPSSASKLVMKAYRAPQTMVPTSNLVAGEPFDIRVEAQDDYDNINTAFNSANLQFAWINANSVPHPQSPFSIERGALVGTPSVASPGLKSFVNGVWASSGGVFTLFNAFDQNVALSLVSPPIPAAPLSFIVQPAAALARVYVQADSQWNSASYISSLPSKTTDSDAFLIYAHGYDAFGNWKGLQSVDWIGVSLPLTRESPRVVSPIANSTFTSIMPFDTGTGTLNLVKPGTSEILASVTQTFTGGSPVRYKIQLDNDDPNSVTAKTPFGIIVRAEDRRGNLTTDYSGPRSLTFTHNMLATGAVAPAPACTPLKANDGVYNFTNGQATISGFQAVNASDNFRITVAGDLAQATTSFKSVVPGLPAHISLSLPSGSTVTAGVPFGAIITVRDACSNRVSAYEGAFRFTLTKANAAVEGGAQPVKPLDGAVTMQTSDSGQMTTANNAFTLVKRTGTNYDNGVTLSAHCHPAGCTLPTSNAVALTVNPVAVTNHVYIQSSNTNFPLPASKLSGTVTNLLASKTATYYAWGYDIYGNARGLETVTWLRNNATNATVAPSSGSSTVVTPGTYTINENSLGTERLTAKLNDVAPQPFIDIPIVVGPAAKLKVTAPSSVAADTTFSVTVLATDNKDNQVTSFSGSKSMTFTFNNANSTVAEPSVCNPSTPGTTNITWPNSGSTSSVNVPGFKAAKRGDNISVTVASSGMANGTSEPIAVSAGSPSKLWMTVNGGNTRTAGQGFDVTTSIRDNCSNLVDSATGGLNFIISNAGTSLEQSLAPISPVNGSIQITTGGTVSTTSGAFKLYKRTGANYDSNVRLKAVCNGCSYTDSPDQNLTVNPGSAAQFYLHSTNLEFPTPSGALTGTLSALLADAGNTKQYFAWSYDTYGNAIQNISVNWSKTNATNSTLSTASGPNTILTPGLNSLGQEVITATNPPFSPTQSVTVIQPIEAGAAKTFVVSYPNGANVTVGSGFPVAIAAKDYYGNTATSFHGTKTINLSWIGTNLTPQRGTTAPMIMGQTRNTHSPSVAFNNGLYTSAATDFIIYSSRASGAAIKAASTGIPESTGPNLVISPAAAADLLLPETLPVLTAGNAASFDVHLVDGYGNLSSQGCSDASLSVTCSTSQGCRSFAAGDYGVTAPNAAKDPVFAATALSNPGTFSVTATMYKASSSTVLGVTGNQVRYSASCATAIERSYPMSVNAQTNIHSVFLSTVANTIPAPTGHISSTACSPGSSVVCPQLYAYPFDQFGNFNNGLNPTWSCPLWEFQDNNASPFNVAPYSSVTGLNSNGHGSGAIQRAYHMNGSIHCKVGGVSRGQTNLALTKVTNRPYQFSCSGWSCSGVASGQPQQANCTLTNNSGYDIATVVVTPPAYGSILADTCHAAVPGVGTAGSCGITLAGESGRASTGIAVTSTISSVYAQDTLATLLNPNSVSIGSGASASLCP